MRRIGLLLTATLLLAPVAASAALAPDTVVSGQLTSTLDSHNASVGDRFTLTNVSSDNGRLRGATIYGHIKRVERAGQGRNAKIALAYDFLRSANGHRYRISGHTTNLQVNTRNNTVKEAGGALAGMLVGNYLGKVVGTNAGGVVGAAGGFLVAKNNRENITVPSGSTVTLDIENSTAL
jgi:hypothetical protein